MVQDRVVKHRSFSDASERRNWFELPLGTLWPAPVSGSGP